MNYFDFSFRSDRSAPAGDRSVRKNDLSSPRSTGKSLKKNKRPNRLALASRVPYRKAMQEKRKFSAANSVRVTKSFVYDKQNLVYAKQSFVCDEQTSICGRQSFVYPEQRLDCGKQSFVGEEQSVVYEEQSFVCDEENVVCHKQNLLLTATTN